MTRAAYLQPLMVADLTRLGRRDKDATKVNVVRTEISTSKGEEEEEEEGKERAEECRAQLGVGKRPF